jgi:glycosyltransferase involved in cell wall biosynthesis
MSNFKVIHITQKFWPTIGGGQKHIFELATQTHELKIDTEVMCLRYHTDLKETNKFGFKIKFCELKTHTNKLLNKIYLFYSIFTMCLASMKERSKEKKNIIHVHDEVPFFFLLCLNIFFNFKLIATEHRSLMPKKELLTKFIDGINYTLAIFLCDRIIAVSRDIEDRIKVFKKKNVVRIENWVDTEYFYPEGKNRKYITFIGRLDRLKGSDIFLRLATRLSRENKNLHFLMVGSGILEEELRKIGKEEKINLTIKEVRNERLREIINRSIVLINPLATKGIGIVTLEGMACGAIVIKSNFQGFTDPIIDGHNGYLFKFDNFEELVNRTSYAIKNYKKLEKIRKNAVKTIKERYNKKNNITQTINLYKQV